MTVQCCTKAVLNAICAQLVDTLQHASSAMSQTAFALFRFGCLVAALLIASLAAVSAKLHYHFAGIFPSMVGTRGGRARAQGC